jgi:hypothetical protein
MVASTFLYGAEICAVKKHGRWIQAAEIRFLEKRVGEDRIKKETLRDEVQIQLMNERWQVTEE